MFEMNRKDAMTFRTLPLKGLVGVTYYYDFTLMNRYVIFHSMSGIYAKYHVFDKATRIQRRILDSRILYCEKNHSLLIPFVMYALRNENGHPWSTKIQGNIEQQDLVNMIFRGVMPQLGFAIREEQIQMAKTMLEGLSKKKITLFEAGVGTGKTMGYLVAAFLVTRTETIYQYMQNPITIATSSIDLQRELVEKEIPKLSNALMRVGIIDRPLRVVVRKGKEHYFCVRRYFSLMRDLRQHSDKYQRQIDLLDSLDLAYHGFDLDEVNIPNYLKQKICVSSSCRNCPQRIMCKYDEYMQFCKTRGAYDIQVTNHNMLLMSQKLKASGEADLLQDSNYFVIDEAHKLMEAANSIYGVELSRGDMFLLTDVLGNYVAKSAKEYSRFSDLLERLESLNKKLFKSILAEVTSKEDRVSMKLSPAVVQMIDDLIVTINQINKYSLKDYQVVRCQNMIATLRMLKSKKNMCWIELDGGTETATLTSIPANISDLISKDLWQTPNSHWVLTSGTICDDSGFSYFKAELGMNKQISEHSILEGRSGSPFDYGKNARLYIPDDLPLPTGEYEPYICAIAERIAQLVEATNGHTAVLFTSYRALNDVYNLLEKRLAHYPLMRMSRSNKLAINQFKESGNGVLFASGSMWEGIDCAGDILSSVIIVRLPFPARSQMMEFKKEQFGNVLNFVDSYATPQMLIKLKQGAGRLIRTEQDTGVVSVLDARAARHGAYHQRVRNAFNQYPLVHSVDEVRNFMSQVKTEEYMEGGKMVA